MDDETVFSRTGMHVMHGCLIVSIQSELHDEAAHQVQKDVLSRVHESGAKGVILDLSTVEIMDSYIARLFADTSRITSILGARTVLVGIRPAVAIALTDLDLSLTDIRTAVTLEHAFQLLEPFIWPGAAATTSADNEAMSCDNLDSSNEDRQTFDLDREREDADLNDVLNYEH
jgi:rsbT antagonist protein RsbS